MENAGKRPLDDDSTMEVNSNQKKLKINSCRHYSSLDDIPIPKVKDNKKWNILPSIVYELLALFKSNKRNKNNKNKLEKVTNCILEETKVLPNQNCEKLKIIQNDNSLENYECTHNNIVQNSPNSKLCSTAQPNELLALKLFIEESIQSLDKSDFFNEETESVKTQKNIKESDQKIELIENKLNEKTSITTMVLPENNIKHDVPTISSNNASKNITQNEISITDSIFKLGYKEQICTYLKKNCIDGMSKISSIKHPPCICQHCVFVDNLPIEQCAVNYKFVANTNVDGQYYSQNDQLLNNNIYSSNMAVSDCSICASKGIFTTNDCNCVNKPNSIHNLNYNADSSKNIWIQDLTSLMRTNEKKYTAHKKSK